jgi:HEAT repeat protein
MAAGKRKFEEQIAKLDELRQLPAEARLEALRKGLGNRNNFIVAKAADLVREFRLTELTPDLLAAFERFFEAPEKNDPQCWAKNSLARTLAAFEHQEPGIFLRGMRHIQLEAVWGGRSDTAGTLRATCAFALVQCRGVPEVDLLAHLVDLLADKDKAVRTEAIRAIEQVGSPSASLLLRARAALGNDEPEVLGACYGGILRIEGVRAIAWLRRFLAPADDAAAEAALAIAATHSSEGFECLKTVMENASDPWWRSVLLSAMSLTRQEPALDYLLHLVATESLDAEPAIDAILRSAPSSEVIGRLEEIVAGNPRLLRHFAAERNATGRR